MYFLVVSLLSALAQRTAAQAVGDNGRTTPTFDAPPLEHANLGINASLAIATFIQLSIAIAFPFRVRSQHIAPGIAAVFALFFLFTVYVLNVVYILVSFLTDGAGKMVVADTVPSSVNSAISFFDSLYEPVMFLTVAFVIRDRYLTYDAKGPNGMNKREFPLSPFMIISYFVAVVMFILSTANAGLIQVIFSSNLPSEKAKLKDANDLEYTYIAVYIVATISLIPMAVVARNKARSDRIINMTLFVIVPLLLVRAMSQMILGIISALLAMSPNFNISALYLTGSIVSGIPYLLVISILCHFFLTIRLWSVPGESSFQPSSNGYAPLKMSDETYTLQKKGPDGYCQNQKPGQQQLPPVTPDSGVARGNRSVDEQSQGSATKVPEHETV